MREHSLGVNRREKQTRSGVIGVVLITKLPQVLQIIIHFDSMKEISRFSFPNDSPSFT